METTLQEAREHLGVETQRQWSDLAILRTTPALLGIFSLITIWANTLSAPSRCIRPRDDAWYVKSKLTFSDAIAAVRRILWAHSNFSMPGKPRDVVEIPRPLFDASRRPFVTLPKSGKVEDFIVFVRRSLIPGTVISGRGRSTVGWKVSRRTSTASMVPIASPRILSKFGGHARNRCQFGGAWGALGSRAGPLRSQRLELTINRQRRDHGPFRSE